VVRKKGVSKGAGEKIYVDGTGRKVGTRDFGEEGVSRRGKREGQNCSLEAWNLEGGEY